MAAAKQELPGAEHESRGSLGDPVSLQLKLLPSPSTTRELLCQAGDSGEGWGPQVAAWFPSAPSSRGCGCMAPGRFLGDFCWKQLLVGTGWMVSGCFSLAG